MSNTLLKYFQKVENATPSKTNETPKTPKTIEKPKVLESIKNKENTPNQPKSENKPKIEKKIDYDLYEDENEDKKKTTNVKADTKSKRNIEDSDSESPKNINKKRRRIMLKSDSEEENNDMEIDKENCEEKKKPEKHSKNKSDSETDEMYEESSEDSDDFIDDEEEEEEDEKPKKKPQEKKKTIINKKKLATPKSSSKAKSNTCSPATKKLANSEAESNDIEITPVEKYIHFTYEFLLEENIKDINGRKKSDPNYDPRTLFVPDDFKKKVTPGLRQWWDLKSTNFDVILFFKLGKFYELYHQDAVIAVRELGLSFMRGDYAHCGFPEIGFSRYADMLVSRGYKVGRVEQTETPEMMADRTKGTKLDKTIRREICRITTPGTKTFNALDSDVANAFSQYLFSVVERVYTVQDKKVKTYGVCFLDTTVGKIYIGQFEDDRNCSKLRTTLAQYPAAHILYDRTNMSKESKNIIDLQNGVKEGLVQEKEMITPSKMLRILSESDYFKEAGEFKWPETFKTLLSDQDTLGLTAKNEFELAINAFGGIYYCLKKCLIEREILSMKNFEIYQPIVNIVTNDIKQNELKKKFVKQKYMVLDSISLTNLEIIENNYDNTQTGTLYEQLDFCNTNFGKRLLKYWVVNPLCDPDAINERLDAIEDLMNMNDKFPTINDLLKSLPDLERLVSKIHQLGNVSKDHPDSRAIMFENNVYSRRKTDDFISILNGFGIANKLLNTLKDIKLKSKLLKLILTITSKDEENANSSRKTGFPYLTELLDYYNNSFDTQKAKEEGKIIPSPGLNEEYDTAIKDLNDCEKKLKSYLNSEIKKLGCTIVYFGSAKVRYQMEIPEHKANKLPAEYELVSSKKGFKRYHTPEVKELVKELIDAETRRDQALRDTIKCLYKNFDQHYKVWNRAIQCLSILDVLVSLTSYVKNSAGVMSRPEIILMEEEKMRTPFIEIVNGRHPCLSKTFSGDFIPNDVFIGCEDSNNNWQKKQLLILTGPNMGGKSTLMRQTGLTVILAQMGCFVPAEKCRISPVDRIFTRIGANDKILAGESTFFLELSETASILHHASKHSLVLMDELGRGTATFDGTAIAYSVVKELAQRINCRTLFSTHYHHLVEEFSDRDNVGMGHMQSIVTDDNQLTFLYKFIEGACEKSHGFNAARLAEIPDDIIKVGSAKSIQFENFTKKIQLLKKVNQLKSKKEVNELIKKFYELKSD